MMLCFKLFKYIYIIFFRTFLYQYKFTVYICPSVLEITSQWQEHPLLEWMVLTYLQ